jgi:hypothetical protein
MFRKNLTAGRHNILRCCILILLFAASCDKKAQEAPQELEFLVDEALIDSCYSDSSVKIAFCPPKGWNPLPDSALKEVRTRMETTMQLSNIQIRLIQFFIDSTNSNFCSLMQVSVVAASPTMVHLAQIYEESLPEKFPKAQINKGRFQIEKIDVIQFLILTEEQVIFKLLFASPTKSICQLDYAIARAIYPKVVRGIESSIGSLTVQ